MSNDMNLRSFFLHKNELVEMGIIDEFTKTALEDLTDNHPFTGIYNAIEENFGISMDVFINQENKIVVIEKNPATNKNIAVILNNKAEIDDYVSHMMNLSIYSTVKDSKFSIDRKVISPSIKPNFEYSNSAVDNLYISKGEMRVIDCESNKVDERLSHNDKLEESIIKDLTGGNNSKSISKYLGIFERLANPVRSYQNNFINLGKYNMTGFQAKKVMNIIHKNFTLTNKQIEALGYYKGIHFQTVNTFLNQCRDNLQYYNGGEEAFIKAIDDKFLQQVETLFETFENQKSEANMVLFRGGSVEEGNGSFEVGQKLVYKNFISTSASHFAADKFCKEVMFEIEMPKEYACVPLELIYNSAAGHRSEGEYVLPPTEFEVADIRLGDKGEKIIKLVPIRQRLNGKELINDSLEFWEIKSKDKTTDREDNIRQSLATFDVHDKKPTIEKSKDKTINDELFEF